MKYSLRFTILLLLVTLLNTRAEVHEVPFIELPTGQVVVKAKLSGIESEQFFILETAGSNYLRRDMNYRLHNLGIDTTLSRVKFSTVSIGDMVFSKNNVYKLKRKLGKRGEYAFPPTVLGTIGASTLQNKVMQIDYLKKVILFADEISELNIKKATQRFPFTSSFMNNIPVMDASSLEFGTQELYVEVSMPVGINFSWSDISLRQNKYAGTFKAYETSLDGEKTIVMSTHSISELYLDDDITVYNLTASFTDEVIPVIGNLFLKNFVTTFDFKKGYIYLEPNTEKGKELLTKPEKK